LSDFFVARGQKDRGRLQTVGRRSSPTREGIRSKRKIRELSANL